MHGYEWLRPLMRLWYAKQLGEGSGAASPRDEPSSRSGDPSADRVLVIGNGPVHGWGVLNHDLALTGRLASALSARTIRATDVDVVGEEVMNTASAVAWLGGRDLGGYDLVYIVLSVNDAVRLTPVDQWRDSLESLLQVVLARTRSTVPVVVAALPSIRSIPRYDQPLGTVGQRHADRLNAEMLDAVEAWPRLHFHRTAPLRFEPDRPLGSARTYTTLAADLAGTGAPLLGADGAAAPRPALPGPDWTWAGTARTLELARSGRLPAIELLQESARRTFGVPLALVTLLEGDRQLIPTGGGSIPMSVPRELTYCQVVADLDAPMIVPNARKDERFRDNPYLDVTHTPFYAGQPLHGLGGEVIGTFCVMGVFPRAASRVPLGTLERFAAEVETELQRIETDVVRAAPGEMAET